MRLLIHRTFAVAALFALGLLALAPSHADAQARPDLVVSTLSTPPATGLPGDSFIVTATIRNQGTAGSVATTTKFYLVAVDNSLKNLKGVQPVIALPAGSADGAPVTLAIFSDTGPGTYKLRACADGNNVVAESNEANNCRTTVATIVVSDVPDLRVTVISDPPASAGQGQSFTLATTTVRNTGSVPAPASTVKYYLVPAAGGTKIDLKGTLAVPGLASATSFTHAQVLTVRPETALGLHKIQACADSGKVVSEEDENNNCLTKETPQIRVTPQADLSVTVASVEGLPKTVNAGDPLNVSAVVKNVGSTNVPATVMKYMLTLTTDTTKTKNLKGTPPVPALAAGATSAPIPAAINVYSDTPSGTYRVEACADSTKVVSEVSEGNNCLQVAGILTVVGKVISTADLVVTNVTNPPATTVAGGSFNVTATVKNNGTGNAPTATSTRFYLIGADATTPAKKNTKGVQPIGALAAGASGGAQVAVTLYSDTVPGNYFLQACADGEEALIETAEGNNCKNSLGKVKVNDVPNLQVTAISNPPTTPVGQGGTFKVTSTVKNVGAVDAATSTVKYYLVSVANASRIDLKGTGTAPLLHASQTFSDEHDVTVRGETVAGLYRLQACADSGKAVPEDDENDNCATSTGSVEVFAVADLVMASVTVPTPQITVKKGATFNVTSAVKNAGGGAAAASATRFSLIQTGAAAPAKDLTPTQAVGALAGGATSAGATTTVTVPLSTATGVYAIQACADFDKKVPEGTESNNCGTSVGTVNIVP